MIANTWTIARRDFRAYFTSPMAYIVITAFVFIMGWMFYNNLYHFSMQNLQFQGMNMGRGPSLTDGLVKPLYGNMNVIFLLMTPFITMRLFAEERKQHTIELLMTSPVTLAEIVLGKFLSAFGLVLVMMLLTAVYPITLALAGNPDLGPVLTSAVGTLFLASCIVAVGVFCSSVTENQIVAGVLTFVIVLFIWLISWASQLTGSVIGDILNYLSLISHYNNFGQGLLNTTDVFYYLSFIGMWLFLTHRVLDSYRWR
jgi:ABC-2 type transport system permease protein